MEQRKFGRTDMQVSVLGFGGGEIGYSGATAVADVATMLNAAIDQGLNVIDTAPCYGNSEELIGAALAGRRREFHLFTKCGHSVGLGLSDWSPDLYERSLERSLRLMRTDYVDLIQLHSCAQSVLKQGDAIAALQRIRDAGKARFIGYSGDGADALYAVRCGAFDSLQISVSIADQAAIDEAIPAAQAAGMGVIAKRPIANAAWRAGADSYSQPYRKRLKKLNYDFVRGDAAHAGAIALRFTLTVPGVHTAIVGTAKPGRWEQNAASISNGGLSAPDFESIRRRWREVARSDWTGQT